jgi:cobalamin biosynthetic protein CobC
MTLPGKTGPRDHGGNLDAAMTRHGGALDDWIDLSTGINPVPYPLPPIPPRAWTDLPRAADMVRLRTAAIRVFETKANIVPFAGAQAAIQAYPLLAEPRKARVLGPTYNEHAAALRTAGWNVSLVPTAFGLEGADLAVLVNPNNPDGRRVAPDSLLTLARTVGLLVVDESFVDPEPELSLAPHLAARIGNILLLRSFGKFYGLAGLRLGFAIAGAELSRRLEEIAGPWPVSGPAIDIACLALADTDWRAATMERLRRDAARLDGLAERAGWRPVGGTSLFRTFETGNAGAAQDRLALHRIWSRIFPYSASWIRLGLPGTDADWQRLEAALR